MITLGWAVFFFMGAATYTTNKLKKKQAPELVIYIAFESLFLSINPHKEDRFLMKLLPLMFIMIGLGIQTFYAALKNRKLRSSLFFFCIFVNLIFFGYSSLLDKRGAIDIMDHLRREGQDLKSLILFTECHRTPLYSSIHKNIPIKFPTCSPFEKNDINDSKLLFINPSYFIHDWITKYQPSHLVLYNSFLENDLVVQTLQQNNFIEEARYFNSFYVDTPVGYDLWHELVLYKKVSS